MSVIINKPKFMEFETRKIFDFLIERECILAMDGDREGLREVKRLLVFIVTNYARLPPNVCSNNH